MSWYNSNQNPENVYRLLEQLGEGSYGSVYKAVHKDSAKVVAMKVVPIDHEESELGDLKKEIQILQQCTSAFIVEYYASYLFESNMWIAMEYCDAGSVADIMEASKSNIMENQIAAICASAMKGLEYLHSKNNIHRDVKAGNILLSYSGHAKLADFGVSAQLCNTIAKRRTVIGTPFWMAPEVIQESSYDGKADIWSLGITAIEMAQGDPPHAQMHPMRAIFLIPSRPPPVLKHPDDFSSEFNDFLAVCLKKNPLERPTAKELLQHPFIQQNVLKLENEKNTGLPIIQELVESSMEAVTSFRTITEEESDSDSDESVDYTSTMVPAKSDATKKDNGEDTEQIRQTERTTEQVDYSNCGTMVFKGRPNVDMGASENLYGTMVFKGKSSNTGTIVTSTKSEPTENEASTPSFMKYFKNTKPTIDSLTEELKSLEIKYIRDQQELERKYQDQVGLLTAQLNDLRQNVTSTEVPVSTV